MWFQRLLPVFFIVAVCAASPAQAVPLIGSKETPVNFMADSLSHDDAAQSVTALGDVELMQGGNILHADKIVYHLAEDRVSAIGNVSLLDEKGDVFFAEYIELRNQMKDGFVQSLLALLADGSRFSATDAERSKNGTVTTMTDASYTACKVCETNPKPLWQIRADKVVHDQNERTVKYDNARLEFMGVPVAWSPIFSHPDPTLKRKSGFLRPQYGYSTTLGTHIKGGYYYDIAPDKDATLVLEPSSLAGMRVEGEWRQRFAHGELQLNASTVNSDRKKEDGRVEESVQRGHVFASGRFDLDDKWRSGFQLQRTTDKQYLKLYDISEEDVLTTQAFAERFDARDYSRISAYRFQDVRLGIRPEQPDVLPYAEHRMLGAPVALWGGRWEAEAGLLGLARSGREQDMERVALAGGWERRDFSRWGLSTISRLSARTDTYFVQDSTAALSDPSLARNANLVRPLATATLISSYPLVKRMTSLQAMIEPIMGVSLSPDVSKDNDEIPNEDSLDVRFDSSNLFDENRFPGIDRQEDGGRVNYGMKAGLYGDDGRYGRVYLGQSYRFAGDRIFPAGSGLERRLSDFVGQIKVGLAENFDADYRFQLDSETMSPRRHEAQAGGGNDTFRLNGRYLYTAAVAGTGFDESREQVQIDGVFKLSEHWSYNASSLYDLGDEPGLRNATTGFTYMDECFTFAIQGARDVADKASGDNDTRLMLRVGLRNIGEFTGPKISLGRAQNQSTAAP